MNARKLRGRVNEIMHDPMLLEVSRLKSTAFTRRREGGMGFPAPFPLCAPTAISPAALTLCRC